MFWQAKVVAFLRECKANGWDWDTAWDQALQRYPPRGVGMGQKQLSLEDDGEPSVLQFFERACRDAWHGYRPELARLGPALMDVPGGPEGTQYNRGTLYA